MRLDLVEVNLVLSSVSESHNSLVAVVDSAHVKDGSFVDFQVLKSTHLWLEAGVIAWVRWIIASWAGNILHGADHWLLSGSKFLECHFLRHNHWSNGSIRHAGMIAWVFWIVPSIHGAVDVLHGAHHHRHLSKLLHL